MKKLVWLIVCLTVLSQCKKTPEPKNNTRSNLGQGQAPQNRVRPKKALKTPYTKAPRGRQSAAFSFTVSMKTWDIIQKKSGGITKILPPELTSHPLSSKLLKVITAPNTVGVDPGRPIHVTLFGGDPAQWTATAQTFNLWAQNALKDTPNLTKQLKKLQPLTQNAPHIHHQILLPITGNTFATFLRTTLSSLVSSSCPVQKGKPVDGLFLLTANKNNCPKLPKFAVGNGLLMGFTLRGHKFLSVRTQNSRALIDIISFPHGFEKSPQPLNQLINEINQEPPKSNPVALGPGLVATLSINSDTFAAATTFTGWIEATGAFPMASKESLEAMIKEVQKIISFAQRFSSRASFLSENMTLSLSQEHVLEATWRLTPMGTHLLKEVISQKPIPLNYTLLYKAIKRIRATQLKRKTALGKITPLQIISCGMQCTFTCIYRMPMECLVPNTLSLDTYKKSMRRLLDKELGPLKGYFTEATISLDKENQLHLRLK